MLVGLSVAEVRDLILSVGTHRGERRLSPVEVSDLLKKAIDAGATKGECSRLLDLTTSTMITRFLGLQKLSSEIRHLVDWRPSNIAISFTSASIIAQLEVDQQHAILNSILKNRMTKEEVRQVIQLIKRSERSLEDCTSEVINMRDIVVRQYVFLGAITDNGVASFLESVSQSERDRLFSSIIKAIYNNPTNLSGRLGTDKFTIVTNEIGGKTVMGDDSEEYEILINKALVQRVLG